VLRRSLIELAAWLAIAAVGRPSASLLPCQSAHIYSTSPDMLKRAQTTLERLNQPTF